MSISTKRERELERAGRFELPRDGTLRLRAGRGGLRLRAERGAILITREGDGEDHVVVPGRESVLTGSGLVVAWALEEAALVVQRAARAAPIRRQRALASSL